MATLNARTSLASLARILHAAALLGPDAWEGRAGGGPVGGSGGGDEGGEGGESGAPRGGGAGEERGLSEDLRRLFEALDRERVRYVLVGGVALLRYIDGRNTDDIDLVMSVASMERVPGLSIEDRTGDFARGRFGALRVDVLLTKNKVFKLVDERFACPQAFRELTVRCATVEGLILLKLYALPALYRSGNAQRVALYESDITMLCLRHGPALGPLLAILSSALTPSELDDLRTVATEIEQRVARLRRVQGGMGDPA